MLHDALRLLGVVMSLLFGSIGVFMLWASFYAPDCGAVAALFLSASTAIVLTAG
jgi:hypothetical protein